MKVSAERLEVAQTAMSGPLKQLETADEFSEQALQDFTLATLFYVLEPQWPGRIIGLGGSHQHIVKYCHERVLESPAGEALSILDLCRELKIPPPARCITASKKSSAVRPSRICRTESPQRRRRSVPLGLHPSQLFQPGVQTSVRAFTLCSNALISG